MKILLIGASGQIGYAVAHALAASGHAVTVLVRDAHKLPYPHGVQVLAAKPFSAQAYASALAGCDAVIYGVGLPEQYTADAGIFEQVNERLLYSFLDALAASPVRRLIYISTYEVFQVIDGAIREHHALADPAPMSAYFAAMTRAYARVLDTAQRHNLKLTTIHPAAVYGGLNTGFGVTQVIENLLNWRIWNLPTVLEGRFPVVHADALAKAIVASVDHTGAFIVSDGMTSLKGIALALRRQARSYVPPTIARGLAYGATAVLESSARALGLRPALSKVQLDFITNGAEPHAERARSVLPWSPCSLDDGLQRYLSERTRLLKLLG